MEWSEVIKIDTKERKVTKDVVKNTNAWKYFIRNGPFHASMANRLENEYIDGGELILGWFLYFSIVSKYVFDKMTNSKN